MRRVNFTGLWHNSDFLKLWAGETVSLFGSKISELAIPLLAVLTLQASPTQMGYLLSAQFAPYLLITLFAGVWIDQRRRRPIMLMANVGRAVCLGAIPALYVVGSLRIEHLYVIVFITSFLGVFFELAYQAYLPALIRRDDLVEGNSKLQASASIAQVSGPSIAGVLIDLLSAPTVIVCDALSYLVSSFALMLIQKQEPTPLTRFDRRTMFREIYFGMKALFADPYLRPIAFEAATFNMFSLMTASVLVMYITRELQIGPSLLGFILGAGSIGALVGSMYATSSGRRFGIGQTIIGSMLLACSAPLIVPLISGSLYIVVPALLFSFFISGVGLAVSNVHVISLRQALIPKHLMGRINACYRFICSGTTPFGALLGGSLGNLIGLRSTLLIAAIGTLGATLWVLLSPIPQLRAMPSQSEGFEQIAARSAS